MKHKMDRRDGVIGPFLNLKTGNSNGEILVHGEILMTKMRKEAAA